MEADRKDLALFEERLAAAWADVDVPRDDDITDHICEECDEIARYFGARPWQNFTDVQELRLHSEALTLFSRTAFHYYLPAFMRATLRDPVTADAIPDGIMFCFECELGAASRDRLSLFSTAQLDVVGEFMEILARQEIEDADDALLLASCLRGT